MLDATPTEITKRKALRVNACKTCQPVGAMYAALGVHGCLPYSHGSHGCVAYHRTVLSRHFKEPVMAASSSFSEGACVFGGKSNLKTGIKNAFDIYNPDIIAVHTTCLSEVIGDDLRSFIMEFDIPEDKTVVYCHTPSFKGSHVDGYVSMMNGFIEQIAKPEADPTGKLAIFPAWSEPSDLREIKRMLALFGIDFTMFPDQSGVVDVPMKDHYEMFPAGGTTLEEIAALGGASKVLGLGPWTMNQTTETLNKKCDVPAEVLPYPISIANTDKLVMALSEFSGKDVPAVLEEERGQLVDLMVDCHIWTSGKTCAIFGDPDYILGTTEFALELGMIPKYVLTGTPGKVFPSVVEEIFARYGVEDQCQAFQYDDLFHLHQLIKNDPVDLLIGTNYGKQIARAEDIPFVRAGWPVLDRYGHHLFPTVGYKGGMRLVERIVDQLLDHLDRTVSDEKFDVVL